MDTGQKLKNLAKRHILSSQKQPSRSWTKTSWFWPSVWAYQSIGHFVALTRMGFNKPILPFLKIYTLSAIKAFFGKSPIIKWPTTKEDHNGILLSWVMEQLVSGIINGHDTYFGNLSANDQKNLLKVYLANGHISSLSINKLIENGHAVILWKWDIFRTLRCLLHISNNLIQQQIRLQDLFIFLDGQFIDAMIIENKFKVFLRKQKKIRFFFLPYEAQPIQHGLLNACSHFPSIKTIGYLHSSLVPLPCDINFSSSAPDKLLVHGSAYLKILPTYLGWPNDRLVLTSSFRYRQRASFKAKIFLPISLLNPDQMLAEFVEVFKKTSRIFQPLTIGLHPTCRNDPVHQRFAQRIDEIFTMNQDRFASDGDNICMIFGVSGVLFEALESGCDVINFISDPDLEVFDSEIFEDLDVIQISNKAYSYSLKKPDSYIKYPDVLSKDLTEIAATIF